MHTTRHADYKTLRQVFRDPYYVPRFHRGYAWGS